MRGTFSQLPDDTLAAALAPIGGHCSTLAWAVSIQSGLLRYSNLRDERCDQWVRTALGDDIPENRMTWLESGFLPARADLLVLDEWSYYLGFDPNKISADTLAAYLSHELQPRPVLFDAIIRFDLLYVFRVDQGWWEAYANNVGMFRQIRTGWNGIVVDSERWDGHNVMYPGTDTAA